MNKQRLYLFVGFPGAGKTTVAKLIADSTGAVHIWADKERLGMFGSPSHSKAESRQLYDHLNDQADKLLADGKSVIFDTNFNFLHDREHLRQIAAKHRAETIVVWLQTPKPIAKQRAVHDRNLRNGYEFKLPDERFEEMASSLEPPTDAEHVVTFDGTDLDPNLVKQKLEL